MLYNRQEWTVQGGRPVEVVCLHRLWHHSSLWFSLFDSCYCEADARGGGGVLVTAFVVAQWLLNCYLDCGALFAISWAILNFLWWIYSSSERSHVYRLVPASYISQDSNTSWPPSPVWNSQNRSSEHKGKKELVLCVEAPSGHISSLPVCSSTTRRKRLPGPSAVPVVQTVVVFFTLFKSHSLCLSLRN